MISVTIDTETLQRKLKELTARIKDPTPANRKAAVQLYAWVMRNFKDEGGLTDKGWAPLAAGGRWTGKGGKHRFDFGARLLQDTGALRQSFEWFADKYRAGVGAKRYSNPKRPNAPEELAKIHQFGTSRIPARPMLPTRKQALEIGVTIYTLHIMGKSQGGETE